MYVAWFILRAQVLYFGTFLLLGYAWMRLTELLSFIFHTVF